MEELWRRTSRRRRTSPARTAPGTATRRSAIPTSCRPTAPTARRARRSPASMWNWRLLLATGRGRYADEMERAALQRDRRLDLASTAATSPTPTRCTCATATTASNEDAPSERLPWFTCACCPPNLARLVASLHRLRRDARRRTASSCTSSRPAAWRALADGRPVRSRWRRTTRGTGASRSPWRARRASGRCRCGSRRGARARPDRRRRAGRRRRRRHGYLRLRRAWDGRAAGRARAADAGARASPRTRASTPCAAAWRSRAGRSSTASSRPTIRRRRGRGPAPRPRRAARAGRRRTASSACPSPSSAPRPSWPPGAGRALPDPRPAAAGDGRAGDAHRDPLLPLGEPRAERDARLDPDRR